MDKARVLTPAEGLMPRCPPSSAVATPEKSSDASFLYAPREYSDQTAEDPLNTQASSPVLKQAPTPRIVSLVEPKHRFSGFSSRVCTASDDHTLSSEEIALEEGQLEAENVTVQTSLGNDEATGRTPTSVWGDTPSRSATELTPPAKAHNGIRKSSLEPVSGKAAFNHSPPLSKRSRFMHPAPWRKRWLTGLWEHFWTPLGVLSAIYALTIFAWGTALFVIIMGWTSLPLFVRFQWVEYCSQVGESAMIAAASSS